MNPRPKDPGNGQREQDAKVRDMVTRKLAARGVDVQTGTAVGPALQRALRENA